MTTPWINNQKMQLIISKQMNTFKSSGVNKKTIDSSFQQINENVKNDIYISNNDDSNVKQVKPINSLENEAILKMCYIMNLFNTYVIGEMNHTGISLEDSGHMSEIVNGGKDSFNEVDNHNIHSVFDTKSNKNDLESINPKYQFFLKDEEIEESNEKNDSKQNNSNFEAEIFTELVLDEEKVENKKLIKTNSIENIVELNTENIESTLISDENNKESNLINTVPTSISNEIKTDKAEDKDNDLDIPLNSKDSLTGSQTDSLNNETNFKKSMSESNSNFPHELQTYEAIDKVNDLDISSKLVDASLEAQIDKINDEANLFNSQPPSHYIDLKTAKDEIKENELTIPSYSVVSPVEEQSEKINNEANLINSEPPSHYIDLKIVKDEIKENELTIPSKSVVSPIEAQIDKTNNESNLINSEPSSHSLEHKTVKAENKDNDLTIPSKSVVSPMGAQIDKINDEANLFNSEPPSHYINLKTVKVENKVDELTIPSKSVVSPIEAQIEKINNEPNLINSEATSNSHEHKTVKPKDKVNIQNIPSTLKNPSLGAQIDKINNESNLINSEPTSNSYETIKPEDKVNDQTISSNSEDSSLGAKVDELNKETNINNSDITSNSKIDFQSDNEMGNNPVFISFDSINYIKSNHTQKDEATKKTNKVKFHQIPLNATQTKNIEELAPFHNTDPFLVNMKPLNNEIPKFESQKNSINETNPSNNQSDYTKYGNIFLKEVKIPFSVNVKINDFLHPPLFGGTSQNNFDFSNVANSQSPQLFNTTTYYYEYPYCSLMSSTISESTFFTEDIQFSSKNTKNYSHSINVIPLHESNVMKNNETINHKNTFNSLYVKIPIIVGEYKIEICMEEELRFNEEILKIKEISKELFLTNSKLVPTTFSDSTDSGKSKVLKGNLFIEGYIKQTIECITEYNINQQKNPVKYLYQNIVIDLIIQLLQIQPIRFSCNHIE